MGKKINLKNIINKDSIIYDWHELDIRTRLEIAWCVLIGKAFELEGVIKNIYLKELTHETK